ncbi:IclR family transcriptional regulator [Arthrobacter zhangbolii]|uniref:IclR family transcriptional regulator n=1 Tax=Arthrobacter zhangbolii TaxID=2886936 RepID=A0A9X1SAC9_9MICC|nr:IclR family transcriptional regulator [Arthrobacter zhangbolii]MCC3273297.1 IclR family transcriptional regulator [Arthrobacter zhangbolii]UON92720.1 IclR family transcriptional regulator [Arthrobacter zhangbolii]
MAPTTDLQPTAGGTEAADRVADVLLLFSRADGALGVSEIARTLKLSKAVVHRILQSLGSRGLLSTVDASGSYVLGPAAIGMGNKAWGQLDFRSIAAPVLRQLRDDTRETTTLSVLMNHSRLYVDQFESPQEIKMVVDIGARHPLHSGASSRAMIAFLPESYVEEAVAALRQSKPDFNEAEYRQLLETVRRDGYATSYNERNIGAASIAAPFFDKTGNVLGAISSCGPIFRFTSADTAGHAAKVTAAAREITRLLAR